MFLFDWFLSLGWVSCYTVLSYQRDPVWPGRDQREWNKSNANATQNRLNGEKKGTETNEKQNMLYETRRSNNKKTNNRLILIKTTTVKIQFPLSFMMVFVCFFLFASRSVFGRGFNMHGWLICFRTASTGTMLKQSIQIPLILCSLIFGFETLVKYAQSFLFNFWKIVSIAILIFNSHVVVMKICEAQIAKPKKKQ